MYKFKPTPPSPTPQLDWLVLRLHNRTALDSNLAWRLPNVHGLCTSLDTIEINYLNTMTALSTSFPIHELWPSCDIQTYLAYTAE